MLGLEKFCSLQGLGTGVSPSVICFLGQHERLCRPVAAMTGRRLISPADGKMTE